MYISPEREDATIIKKYTKIFDVQVNRRGCILDNSRRKISKQLNTTWIPTAWKVPSQIWHTGYLKEKNSTFLEKYAHVLPFFFLFFNKCSIKPVKIQLFNWLWTTVSIPVRRMLIKKKLLYHKRWVNLKQVFPLRQNYFSWLLSAAQMIGQFKHQKFFNR